MAGGAIARHAAPQAAALSPAAHGMAWLRAGI